MTRTHSFQQVRTPLFPHPRSCDKHPKRPTRPTRRVRGISQFRRTQPFSTWYRTSTGIHTVSKMSVSSSWHVYAYIRWNASPKTYSRTVAIDATRCDKHPKIITTHIMRSRHHTSPNFVALQDAASVFAQQCIDTTLRYVRVRENTSPKTYRY
jgi:hypothetical protein